MTGAKSSSPNRALNRINWSSSRCWPRKRSTKWSDHTCLIAATVSGDRSCPRLTPSISAPSAAPVGRTITVGRSNTAAIDDDSLFELHADGCGDERRACRALDLHCAFRGDAHAAALDRLDRFDLLAQPDARAGRHLSGEAHSVRSVIEAARTLLDPVEGCSESRHQRQCQVAVGDRLAARHLALGALDIDMDPLMVAGRIGEFVDDCLVEGEPVADPNLLADILGEIGRPLDLYHTLSLSGICAESSMTPTYIGCQIR